MRLFAFFAVLVLRGVAAAALTLPASSGTSYSAFRIIGGPGPGRAGWVYHDDGKERFERAMGRLPQVVIRRPDLGVIYNINPLADTAQEVPINQSSYGSELAALLALPAQAQGREMLRGEAVTNFSVVDGYGQTHYYSLTSDGIPLRIVLTAGIETTHIEMRHLKRGPQPAHLFEVPDDIEIEVVK